MKKRNILTSNDLDLFFRLERTFLQREEFQLITARSGREVLEFAKQTLFSLIFLDFLLPDMDGVDCCLSIKNDEHCRRTPVIMVVHNGHDTDIERCKKAGCDAIVTRPLNKSNLLDTARTFLQIKERLPRRYPLRFLVNYGSLHGNAVNVSAGGLFIETDHPGAIDSVRPLEIILPQDAQIIRCKAKVTWVNRPENLQNQGLPPGMGLYFMDMNPIDQKRLQKVMLQEDLASLNGQSLQDITANRESEESTKILIVGSHSGNKRRLRAILEQEEYEILEAESETAFVLAVNEHPDLIIMDVVHPSEDDLCTKLRKKMQLVDIPVLFVSGWSFTFGEKRVLGADVMESIGRPFKERDVLAKVKNSLNIHQLSEALSRTRKEIFVKDCVQEESMQAAAIIQRSLLPSTIPNIESFDFAWRFMPCERVGGDLFNIFKIDETHVGVYILDVSGQGVPAAMMATSVAQALNPANSRLLKTMTTVPPFYKLVSPATVMSKLNLEYPIERFEKHFTICYLLLDVQSGRLSYCNAAHPFPVLLRADGRVERLSVGGTIIGLGEGITYEEGTVQLVTGDRLFLFTDGIIEHTDKEGEFYGEQRFIGELQSGTGETLQMACAGIINSLLDFAGREKPEDDITLVGIEFRESGSVE